MVINNGLILQWLNNGMNKFINFPISFSNTCYAINVTGNDNNFGITYFSQNWSLTQVYIGCYLDNGRGAYNSTGCSCICIGT